MYSTYVAMACCSGLTDLRLCRRVRYPKIAESRELTLRIDCTCSLRRVHCGLKVRVLPERWQCRMQLASVWHRLLYPRMHHHPRPVGKVWKDIPCFAGVLPHGHHGPRCLQGWSWLLTRLLSYAHWHGRALHKRFGSDSFRCCPSARTASRIVSSFYNLVLSSA